MDGPAASNSLENDDEIMKEIPIFNSTRLQKNLYLLRFPLISKQCPNELGLRGGFFKPNNQEVELDMSIDVESSNFDSDRAELMAHEVDGDPDNRKPTNKNVYFENNLVDKVCLKSSQLAINPKKYAALMYTGKEMHLTTVHNVFKFQPHFPYLDRGKKRKDADHNDLSDEEEAGPSTAELVTVKFKQGDDRWKKSKDSFKTLQNKSADEAWIPCEVHSESSAFSKVEKLKLIAENSESTGQAMNLSDPEYLKVLVPEHVGQGTTEPSSPSHIMSLHTLRALPILEQCRLLLKEAQIIQFHQVMMILAGGEGLTADTLLKTLLKVAVLVRGNWVIKSEVLYPSNTLSSTSGIPAELMCRTRDYVLYLFTKNEYVERKKVSSVMKIPSEEVKEIFMGFSKLSHNKGWELVLPTDNDFIVKHSEIVQKQKDAWEEKFKQLSAFLKDNQKQRRKSKSVSEDSKVRNGANYLSSDESGTEKNKSPVVARKNKISKIKDSIQDNTV